MTLSETPHVEAFRVFEGSVCSVCQHSKKRFDSFCSKCYFKLDTTQRQALYKRFGDGYEDAYFEAKEYLLGELKAND